MLKIATLLSTCATALWCQSLNIHTAGTRDSIDFSGLDSLGFESVGAADATLLAFTKSGTKKYPVRSVDSMKIAQVVVSDTGRANLGLAWMFLGDSQTGGRAAEATAVSHVVAFRTIWDKTFPAQTAAFHVNGESGRGLQATAQYYASRSDRSNRTWVHFQESGGQQQAGQATAEEFGATWEAFVRSVRTGSPNAVISTETAYSFQREGEANRNWTDYNTALRARLATLAQQGIKVHLSEVDRNIKDLVVALGFSTVITDDGGHYQGVGNLMIALSMFAALGYDVNALDLSGVTGISVDHKAKCLEIVKTGLP